MTNDLTRKLQDNELDAVTGGGFSSVSNAIGGIGKALQSVANDRGNTIVVFGVEIPLPPPK